MSRRCFHKLEDSQEDIQYWIEQFHHLTFQTSILPLSKAVAQAYIIDYRSRYCSGPLPTIDDVNLLTQLANDIDNIISHLSPPCFIRLTSRSPKDAVQFNFQDFLTNSSDLTINDKLKLYFQLMTENMQIFSGVQALKLLKESERVYVDIVQSIQADDEPNTSHYCPWNLGICIRKWDNRINDQWEFRCFIYNYQLVAISQYNTYIYCPELLEHKENISNLIMKFYQHHILKIFQSIHKPNCILDVAVFPPPPSLGDLTLSLHDMLRYIIIIELNPYNSRTGGGCFRWDIDHNILFNNNHRVEDDVIFRLVGEESSFDITQFNQYQENLYEGLISEYQRELSRNLVQQDDQPKQSDDNSTKCLIM